MTFRIGILACGLSLLLLAEASPAIVIDINSSQEAAILPNHSSNPYGSVAYTPGCSAMPIADRLVLTAAHCISPGQTRSYAFIPYDDKPDVLHCGSVVTYPGYNRAVKPFHQTHVPDLAVLILDLDLPDYVKRYRLAPLSGSMTGALIELVGYGNTGTGITGQIVGSNSPTTKRYVRNEVDRYEAGGNFFSFDFDGGIRLPPCDKACASNGGYGPGSTIGLNRQGSPGLGPIEGAAAQGDSGGPAFFNPLRDLELAYTLGLVTFPKLVPDEPFVVGVTSYQSAYNKQLLSSFGTTHKYVNVVKFRDWLAQFASLDSTQAALTVSASRPEAAASTLPSEEIEYMAGVDLDMNLMIAMAGDGIRLGDALKYCENPQQDDAQDEEPLGPGPDIDGEADVGGNPDTGTDGGNNGSADSTNLGNAGVSSGGAGAVNPFLLGMMLLYLLGRWHLRPRARRYAGHCAR